jgi:hypothetical protein
MFDPEGCRLIPSFIYQHKPLLNVCTVYSVCDKVCFITLSQTDCVLVKICVYCPAKVSLMYSLQTYMI